MATMSDAHEAQGKNLLTFLRKYSPDEPGTRKHSEWVEDVRKSSIGAQASFYHLLRDGQLIDDGYPFLYSALATFDGFTIAEGPERTEASSAMGDMENFVGNFQVTESTLLAYAVRAIAWQMEGIMDGLGRIQDRLEEANNL